MKKSKLFITIITILLVFAFISAQENELKKTDNKNFRKNPKNIIKALKKVPYGSIKLNGSIFFSTQKPPRGNLPNFLSYNFAAIAKSKGIIVAAAKIDGHSLERLSNKFKGAIWMNNFPENIKLTLGIKMGNRETNSPMIWLNAASLYLDTHIKEITLPLSGTQIPFAPGGVVATSGIQFKWTFTQNNRNLFVTLGVNSTKHVWTKEPVTTDHVFIPINFFKENSSCWLGIWIRDQNWTFSKYVSSSDSGLSAGNSAYLFFKTKNSRIVYGD